MSQSRDAAMAECNTLRENLAEYNKQLGTTIAERDTLRIELNGLGERLGALQQEHNTALAQVSQELGLSKQESESLRQQSAEAGHHLQNSRAEQAALTQQLGDLSRRLAELQEER